MFILLFARMPLLLLLRLFPVDAVIIVGIIIIIVIVVAVAVVVVTRFQ